METLEWSSTDKTGWPDGPWLTEPDKMQWQDEATGLACLIVRNHGGALCGYVGVPSTHAWHGKEYNDRLGVCEHVRDDPDSSYCWTCPTIDSKVEVHGGLTFSGGCGHSPDPAVGICHVPGEGEPDDVWWFGFDCAHCNDISPTYSIGMQHASYKDVAYVKADVARLAAQLAEVAL